MWGLVAVMLAMMYGATLVFVALLVSAQTNTVALIVERKGKGVEVGQLQTFFEGKRR